MTIDEMKNKISMDLGGKDTQLGFEVICKKLTELEKENAELKAQISKYEETIDIEQDLNKDAAREIELYQQENAELKGYKNIVDTLKAEGFETFCEVRMFLQHHKEIEEENKRLKENQK